MHKVHAQDQHSRIYRPAHDRHHLGGIVDHVSPATEAVLPLLGSDGLKLQLANDRICKMARNTKCEDKSPATTLDRDWSNRDGSSLAYSLPSNQTHYKISEQQAAIP